MITKRTALYTGIGWIALSKLRTTGARRLRNLSNYCMQYRKQMSRYKNLPQWNRMWCQKRLTIHLVQSKLWGNNFCLLFTMVKGDKIITCFRQQGYISHSGKLSWPCDRRECLGLGFVYPMNPCGNTNSHGGSAVSATVSFNNTFRLDILLLQLQ